MNHKSFNVIKRTGLKQQRELELLFGVSRLMVNRYIRGKASPGRHTAPRIELTLKVLADLERQGKLPLPESYDAERRMRAIEKLKVFIDQRL